MRSYVVSPLVSCLAALGCGPRPRLLTRFTVRAARGLPAERRRRDRRLPNKWAAAVGVHGDLHADVRRGPVDEPPGRAPGSPRGRLRRQRQRLGRRRRRSRRAHDRRRRAPGRSRTPTSAATLRAIRFATSSDGVVAGDDGALAVTHDGGATWTLATPVTSATLRAAAVAVTVGLTLVVGDAGTVLRSTDGGDLTTASISRREPTSLASRPDAAGWALRDRRGSMRMAPSGRAWTRARRRADQAAAARPARSGCARPEDGALVVAGGAHGLVMALVMASADG